MSETRLPRVKEKQQSGIDYYKLVKYDAFSNDIQLIQYYLLLQRLRLC